MTDQTARTPPTILTLILLTGVVTPTLNMFVPSLVNIAAELKADYALVSISIAGYLAVTAVLQIVVGPLSDRYGRRPVILIGTAIFTVASIGCLFAQNIWLFLGCRFVQAVVIAGGGPCRNRKQRSRSTAGIVLGVYLIGLISALWV